MANHKRHIEKKIQSAVARIDHLRKQIDSAMTDMAGIGCTWDLQVKIVELTIAFAKTMHELATRANRSGSYPVHNTLKIFRELNDLKEFESDLLAGVIVFAKHEQDRFFKEVSQTADNLSKAISGKTVHELEQQ